MRRVAYSSSPIVTSHGSRVTSHVRRAQKAQICILISPFPATLTHSLPRKSFLCHSYANTRDGCAICVANIFVPRSVSRCLCGKPSSLSTFRINTCKTVSKQTALTSFRINTYEKTGGGGR
jgi:hypothetical protein